MNRWRARGALQCNCGDNIMAVAAALDTFPARFCSLPAGSVAYSLGRRHPHSASSPLVDFDLALVLAPPLLLGVSCGVLANIALPSW